MNKKMILGLVFVLVTFSGLAFSCSAENAEDVFKQVVEASLKEAEGKDLPKPLGILFGDEQINFHIKMENGVQLVLGLVTENEKVKSVSLDEVSQPTLNVYADEAAVKEIQEAENTFLALKKALDEKRVTYEAVGFLNKIKFAFLSVFSNLVSLFVNEGTEIGEKISGQITGNTALELEDEAEEDAAEPVEDRPEEETGSSITGSGVADLADEPAVEDAVEEGSETHTVYMDNTGFNPKELTIGAGDTVVWENTRTGSINKAMVIGVRNCVRIKSQLFGSGESFSWTFDEAGECVFVDGIMTTESSKIVVGG